jgi:hypothetical protein
MQQLVVKSPPTTLQVPRLQRRAGLFRVLVGALAVAALMVCAAFSVPRHAGPAARLGHVAMVGMYSTAFATVAPALRIVQVSVFMCALIGLV